jgi:hypothetical protein
MSQTEPGYRHGDPVTVPGATAPLRVVEHHTPWVELTPPDIAVGFTVHQDELDQPLKIGSLFTGYGGLDQAARAVFGGELAWVSDNHPSAVTLLQHRHANDDDPNDGAIHLKGDREDGEVETWLGWTEESGWYRGTDRDGNGLNGIRWAWISVLATPDEVLAWLRRIESSVAAIWEMDRPRYRNFDDNDDFGAQLAKAGEDQ